MKREECKEWAKEEAVWNRLKNPFKRMRFVVEIKSKLAATATCQRAQWTRMQISPDPNDIHLQGQNRLAFYHHYHPPNHNKRLSARCEPAPTRLLRDNTLTGVLTIWCRAREIQPQEQVSSAYFSLKQKARVEWALCTCAHQPPRQENLYKSLTCQSWRRPANTDSLNLLFTFLHTAETVVREARRTKVTAQVYKRV